MYTINYILLLQTTFCSIEIHAKITIKALKYRLDADILIHLHNLL